MINYNIFLKSEEWKEIKSFLKDEIVDKPLYVKTEGKTAEVIALEYKASELAGKKIDKAIKRLERKMKAPLIENKPFI